MHCMSERKERSDRREAMNIREIAKGTMPSALYERTEGTKRAKELSEANGRNEATEGKRSEGTERNEATEGKRSEGSDGLMNERSERKERRERKN